jgi:hypothetical protein
MEDEFQKNKVVGGEPNAQSESSGLGSYDSRVEDGLKEEAVLNLELGKSSL